MNNWKGLKIILWIQPIAYPSLKHPRSPIGIMRLNAGLGNVEYQVHISSRIHTWLVVLFFLHWRGIYRSQINSSRWSTVQGIQHSFYIRTAASVNPPLFNSSWDGAVYCKGYEVSGRASRCSRWCSLACNQISSHLKHTN